MWGMCSEKLELWDLGAAHTVTWNKSCALVDGVWNFIVNTEGGDVTWWKSQSYKAACAAPAGQCVRMELLEAQPWLFWGHSGIVPSSADTEVRAPGTNTTRERCRAVQPCCHGKGWGRCGEAARKVSPLWGTCVYLLIN